MKRYICILLSLVLLSACAVNAAAETVTVYEYNLVSKGASYTYSACYTTPGLGYTQVDGKELTDGTLPKDDYGTEWIAFDYRIEAPMHATIDFGKRIR